MREGRGGAGEGLGTWVGPRRHRASRRVYPGLSLPPCLASPWCCPKPPRQRQIFDCSTPPSSWVETVYLRTTGLCPRGNTGGRPGRGRAGAGSRAQAHRRDRPASCKEGGRAGVGAAVHVVGGPVENVRKGCQRLCWTRARWGCAGQEAGLGCRARPFARGSDQEGARRAICPPYAPARPSLRLFPHLTSTMS